MDMVERVAEAIFEAWAKEEGAESTWAEVCDRATREGYPHAKKFRSMALAEARAAIEAMRDPTNIMEDAATAAHDAYEASTEGFWDGPTSVWKAMIDAALTPSQP